MNSPAYVCSATNTKQARPAAKTLSQQHLTAVFTAEFHSKQASKLTRLNLIFSHHLESIMLQCPHFEENKFERFSGTDQPTYLNGTIE